MIGFVLFYMLVWFVLFGLDCVVWSRLLCLFVVVWFVWCDLFVGCAMFVLIVFVCFVFCVGF